MEKSHKSVLLLKIQKIVSLLRYKNTNTKIRNSLPSSKKKNDEIETEPNDLVVLSDDNYFNIH